MTMPSSEPNFTELFPPPADSEYESVWPKLSRFEAIVHAVAPWYFAAVAAFMICAALYVFMFHMPR
jgi:hypothetical protein